MDFYVNRCRLFCPGDEAPDTGFIPPMQRRKMSRLTRIAIGMAEEVAGGDRLPVVFASRFGEWRQSAEQMLRYFKDKEVSPVGFGFSVHNTAPSWVSILKGNQKAYTAISGAERTFDSGLLEAAATLHTEDEVLFLCAAEETPETYRSVFGGEPMEFAVALRLGRARMDASAAGLTIDFASRSSVSGGDLCRARDFVRFMCRSAAAPPLFDGPFYALRRCEK